MILIYAIWLSFHRRWFGGGWKDKLPTNRFLQHIIGGFVAFAVLFIEGKSWWQSLLACIALQALYWAIGHGPAFDMSRDTNPSPATIKRYKKYFWNKWCEFLVPIQSWYGFGYDFLWMMFRYGLPAILISVILWRVWFSFATLFVPIIYAFAWSMHDYGKLKKLPAVAFAEYITGFITGILLQL